MTFVIYILRRSYFDKERQTLRSNSIESPGTRFTNDFAIIIQMSRKLSFTVKIYSWLLLLLQNFTHAMTAQLLCPVQNFVVINLVEMQFPSNLYYEGKIVSETNGPLAVSAWDCHQGDKMVIKLSYLHNETSYPDKPHSLDSISPPGMSHKCVRGQVRGD